MRSDYNTEPGNAASFSMQPGTYTWTAQNITDVKTWPFATTAFYSFFSIQHTASGTVTVTSIDECIVIPIIF